MYDLKNKILYILENLMKTRSLSYSKAENEASEFIYDYLSKIKYFQDNKEYLIRYKIENDVYNREIICAVVKGNNDMFSFCASKGIYNINNKKIIFFIVISNFTAEHSYIYF